MNEHQKNHLKNDMFFMLLSGSGGGLFGLMFSDSNPLSDFAIGFIIGLSVCFFAILYSHRIKPHLRGLPFLLELAITSAYYSLTITTVVFTVFNLFNLHEFIKNFLLPILIYSVLATLLLNFLAAIINLVGLSELLRIFSGHYNRPFEERRIFMFLDLKGSTALAEKLGNLKFHSFLNDFIYTATPLILERRGDIYKYIGDEIIISWKPKKGLEYLNCLRLFFQIQNQISTNHDFFMSKYGETPDFRAGIHVGTVVVGEMGEVKREIAYLGDVVNTTARITTEASSRNIGLLISEDMVNAISSNKWKTDYLFSPLTRIALRGKSSEINLFEVSEQ
ncbi:MAG: adenylate/guanylate cyclase domain-containing protein [Spirochaetes bacterium]|jgi:adenylate cyclase|nr:adenylate/guanylate cyclase domain-containing protein [Spirochaetota bacterium]